MHWTPEDIAFMEKALEQARMAAKTGEVPVGAVLTNAEGKILAQAFNQPISLCDPTAHAEILALREAAKRAGNYRLLGCTIYVTLEPCPMCAGALVYARIKRLVFATHDPKAGACGTIFNIVDNKYLNHRIQVCAGLLAEKAQKLLQDFFKQRR